MKEQNPKIRKNTKYRVRKPIHGKKVLAVVIALSLVLGIAVVPKLPIFGAFNPAEATTYAAYRQDHEIESGTLFIGTYLIHISAMNEAYYTEASESATDSEQFDKYYFSELASGAWRNISDAESLDDLGPNSGSPATEEELGPLYITYVIGSDGVKTNAATGEQIGAFDNPDPYDLYNLPQLSAVRNAYAGSETAPEPSLSEFLKARGQTVTSSLVGGDSYEKGEEASRSVTNDTFIYYAFNGFFKSNVKNEFTDRCDSQLAVLQEMYNNYVTSDDQERADAVFNLMEAVDAARRAEVFRQLVENENTGYLFVLAAQLEGQGYYGSDTFKTDMGETEGVSSAEDTCSNTYYEYLGKALVEGDTIMSNAIYETGTDVIENGGTAAVDKLISLYNIRDGKIEDADAEVAVIDSDLIDEADDKFASGLRNGVSAEYMAEKRKNGAVAAQSHLVDQRNKLESVRTSELEFLIDARRKRLSSDEALDFIFDRIDWANTKYSTIQNDDFKENATEVLDEHIAWLRDVAAEIAGEDSSLGGTISDLKDQIDDANKERDKALDNNDLNTAQAYEAKVDELQDKLAAETQKQTQILNSDNASAREKEEAKMALGDGTEAMADSLLDNALGAIADGNADSVQTAAEGLAVLGATDQLNSLKDRLDSMSGNSGNDGSGSGNDGSGSVNDGSGNGSGNGTGDDGSGSGNDGSGDDGSGNGNDSGGSPGSLSNTDLAGLKNVVEDAIDASENAELGKDVTDGDDMSNLEDGIEDIFGGALDGLSGADLAGAIAGLSMLGEDGNATASYMASKLARENRSKLDFLYEQIIDDRTSEYVSLYTIGKVTSYRYIYYDERNVTTMFGQASSLSFKPDNKTVINAQGKKRELSGNAKKNSTLYVREGDSTDYFSCEAQYVPDSTLAVCMTPSVKEAAQTFYDTFKDKI